MNPYEDIDWMLNGVKQDNRKEADHIITAKKKIAIIRKEIWLDIQTGTPVDTARQKANAKYGKGWRERGIVSNTE